MSLQSTPRLDLPLIQGGQAQKHLTLNEGLWKLDGLIHTKIISRTLANQPLTPSDGDCYILPTNRIGVDWVDFSPQEAVIFWGGDWQKLNIPLGGIAFVTDENTHYRRTDMAWVLLFQLPNTFSDLTGLGIGTVPNATNRLSVNSPQVLFNHAGSNSLVYINKKASTDEAVLIFQTDFSTRAVMGVSSGNEFTIKLSADGTAFTNAISLSATSNSVLKVRATAGKAHLSNENEATVLNSGASINFGDMAGLIVVVNLNNSATGLFLCGGGVALLVASNGSLTGSFSFLSAPNRFVFTNTAATQGTFQFLTLFACSLV
jgi:hypothetical protein